VNAPHDKEMEQTRRVGVSVSRAVVGVSPRRSVPCLELQRSER
jgi:hypothetical protein